MPPQISDGSAIVTIKADDFKRENSLYTIVDGPSWIESERAAQKLGGNLVAIESAAENEYIAQKFLDNTWGRHNNCLLYTSTSPRDAHESRMPSSA